MPGRSRQMSRPQRWNILDRRDAAENTRVSNGRIVEVAALLVSCLPRSGQSQAWALVAVSSDLSFECLLRRGFGNVDQARPSSFPSATISLNATFLIFPLGVSGNDSVRKYLAGTLYFAMRLAQ
jgi:hypothetical protein